MQDEPAVRGRGAAGFGRAVATSGQASFAESALTLTSPASAPAAGAADRDHERPFQCIIRAVTLPGLPEVAEPTAQTLRADTASTACRLPGIAVLRRDQAFPPQCSTSGELPDVPTAHTSRAEAADTPLRLPAEPPFGIGANDHALPFQCMIMYRSGAVNDLQCDRQ